MADDLTSRTWYIDSTGAKSTTPVKIKRIKWHDPGSDGDILEVRESDGGNIISRLEAKAGYDMTDEVGGWRSGVYVQTLDSGKVLITIE